MATTVGTGRTRLQVVATSTGHGRAGLFAPWSRNGVILAAIQGLLERRPSRLLSSFPAAADFTDTVERDVSYSDSEQPQDNPCQDSPGARPGSWARGCARRNRWQPRLPCHPSTTGFAPLSRTGRAPWHAPWRSLTVYPCWIYPLRC